MQCEAASDFRRAEAAGGNIPYACHGTGEDFRQSREGEDTRVFESVY